MLKVYEYAKCSTCVKALKFLESKKIKYEKIAIVDHPPKMSELKTMLTALQESGGGIKNLFNTSGLVYKELSLSEKLPHLSEDEALKLLAQNGKLVKRPFVIGEGVFLTGFKEDQWKKYF